MKIVIVDDEQAIREGLRHLIEQLDATEMAFEVVGIYANAETALEGLIYAPADILLTDIRMPGMDGIELAEMVRERFPRVRIVLISGYSDFAYLQKAIQIGIQDYLLKPVQQQDLLRTIKRIAHTEQAGKRKDLLWEWDRFAYNEAPCKCVVVADLDDLSSPRALEFGDSSLLNWLLFQTARELLELMSDAHLLRYSMSSTSHLIIGVYGNSASQVEATASRIVDELALFWQEKIRVPLSTGMSRVVHAREAADVYGCLLEAAQALFIRVTAGPGLRTYRELHQYAGAEESGQTKELLVHASWNVGDLDKAIEQLRFLLEETVNSLHPPGVLRTTERIVVSLMKLIQKSSAAQAPTTIQDTSRFMNELLWMRSKEQYVRYVMGWVMELVSTVEKVKPEGYILNKAKQYTQEHLHTAMTLTDVANHVYVTAPYLSRLFKERSGITFMKYLTHLRMERALELLKDPRLKIYDVAEQVGYSSWKHFSKTFRDTTGLTPGEYRKQLAGSGAGLEEGEGGEGESVEDEAE